MVGHALENGQQMLDCVVGWPFLLTPWLLSTWFGDWLASQSPNPSWQHRVSLKHLQNTAILCHCVSLLDMLCHLGGWDLVADTWSSSHRTCSKLTKHQVMLTILVLVLLDRQNSKNSDFENQNLFHVGLPHTGWSLSTWILEGGCHMLGGLCQLEFWKWVATCWVVSASLNFGRGLPHAGWSLSTWILEELFKKGMRNLNNHTAQLVGTSWD